MKNRIIRLVVSLVLIVGVAVGLFVAQGINLYEGELKTERYSETFEGYLSNSFYETKEAVAQQFVSYELSSAGNTLTYAGYTKIRDLDSNEIEKIAMLADELIEITSGESVEIFYSTSSDSDTYKKVRASIVRVGDVFTYYLPLQQAGEDLARSYFETLNLNSIDNLSIDAKLRINYISSDGEYNKTVVKTQKLRMSQSEGMNFEETGTKGKYKLAYRLDDLDNVYYKGFDDDRASHYSVSNQSSLGTDFGLDNIDDVWAFDYEGYDWSYFVKTEHGIALRESYVYDACRDIIPSDELEDIYISNLGMTSFRCEWVVAEGRLSHSITSITLEGYNNSSRLMIYFERDFYDYNATEISVP